MRTVDMLRVMTIDVEDWFHILDSPIVPKIHEWGVLESRVADNTERILSLLDENAVKATFFWLGWIAERNKNLVRRCVTLGHEVASHGYGHVLAYQVGQKAFAEDVRHGKTVLEDIVGCEVAGFRAPGFSITDGTQWVFEEIHAAGHTYDSSVFPTSRGHGGITGFQLAPHMMTIGGGKLVEIPQSVVEIMGMRMSFFGGGYLRLAPQWLIKWGINRLHTDGRPLCIYVHPREIDPDHPRLPLPLLRRFKCYVNLKTTLPKLQWLCRNYRFHTISELVSHYFGIDKESAPNIKQTIGRQGVFRIQEMKRQHQKSQIPEYSETRHSPEINANKEEKPNEPGV